jgi:N-acetylmuramoyl-L-alanine amidase
MIRTLIVRWLVLIGLAGLSVPAGAGVTPFVHGGVRLVRLDELAAFYNGVLEPLPGGAVRMKTPWAHLDFNPGGREVRIGGTLVWLHEPMQSVRGFWTLHERDALAVIDPVVRPAEALRLAGARVVVLDAGHGGQDTGAKGRNGVEEKRAALDIARRVRTHLQAAGLTVYMTRENDRFIALEERAERARRWNADLFVSIHLNSASSTLAEGAETYVLSAAGHASTAGGGRGAAAPGNRHDAANAVLGFHLHRQLLAATGAIDRGVKRARFIVLRQAPCPAVLVECGFLSHAAEEARVMDPAYREQVARGIAKGVVAYVGLSRKAKGTVQP